MKFFFILMAILGGTANAKPLSVVTTTTDLAWAARQLAGPRADVHSLLEGTENPHYLDASPSFIRLVAGADVVCLVGMDLEVGWLPKVLERSGNAKVQPGGAGYCEAGKSVKALEVPKGPVDRSMGDVHPLGNPHFWLSPTALGDAAKTIADSLSAADPQGAAFYAKNLRELRAKLQAIQERNQQRLAKLDKKPLVVEYHKEFTYFLSAYDMVAFGSIEEKPGVPPSAGRIAEMAAKAKAAGVSLVLAANYNPRATLEKFEELSGIPVLVVATSLSKDGKLADYEAFQASLMERIVAVVGNRVAAAIR